MQLLGILDEFANGQLPRSYLAVTWSRNCVSANADVQDVLFTCNLSPRLIVLVFGSIESVFVVTGIKFCIVKLAPLVARILQAVKGQ